MSLLSFLMNKSLLFSHPLRELQQHGQLMAALEQMTRRITRCEIQQRKTRLQHCPPPQTTHERKRERDPEPRFFRSPEAAETRR